MSAASFAVAELEAAPGTTTTGYCTVDVGQASLALPIAITNGAKPGPVLAVTAGIHGGEYVPMLAVRRFVKALDPAKMSGTVVASLQSSPASFLERSAFINPLDGKNLNRNFPGNASGTPTERLADWIWKNVISGSDIYIDCHCGDMPEALEGFTGIVLTGNPTVDERALAIADCFPVPRTISTTTSGSTIAAASQAGIPAVLVELGGLGQWAEAEVRGQFDGLVAAAAELGILALDSRRTLSPQPRYEVAAGVESEYDGLWFPAVQPGQQVAVGDVIGTVEDIFGSVIATVTSPVEGVYIYGLTSLAVHVGDFLAAFARPAVWR